MNISGEINIGYITKNIEFDGIGANEEILIQTENSTYRFAIADAETRRGFLSGGTLGNTPRVAILMGAISRDGERYVNDPLSLKIASRAFFYLETENGMKHLITSVITNLAHIKNEAQKYIF
jgi:hypothetical protein